MAFHIGDQKLLSSEYREALPKTDQLLGDIDQLLGEQLGSNLTGETAQKLGSIGLTKE